MPASATNSIRLAEGLALSPAGTAPGESLLTPLFQSLPPSGSWPLGEWEVVASANLVPGMGPAALVRAGSMRALAIMQPLEWSDVSPSWAQSTAAAGMMALYSCMPAVPAAPAAQMTSAPVPGPWTLSPDDVFVPADLDGDGMDEILVVNPPSGAGAVLRYQDGALVVVWSGTTITGAGGSWTFAALDSFQAARLTGTGAQVLAQSPSRTTVGVIGWSGGAPSLLSSQAVIGGASSWTVYASDQYALARLDTSGVQRVILFSGQNQTIGVASWSGSALQVDWVLASAGSIPADPAAPPSQTLQPYPLTGWSPLGGDPFGMVVAGIDGDGTDVLVMTNTRSPTLAVVHWDGSALVCRWMVTLLVGGALICEIPLTGIQPTPLSPDGVRDVLVFHAIPVPLTTPSLGVLASDGGTGLAVQTAQAVFPGASGAAGWNYALSQSWAVVPSRQPGVQQVAILDGSGNLGLLVPGSAGFTCAWTVARAMPGWGLDLLFTAPATPLAPFADDLQQAYAALSGVAEPGCTDIRAQYDNQNASARASAWQSNVHNQSSPPPGSPVDPGAWQQVWQVLDPELASVGWVYGLAGTAETMADLVSAQQQADLGIVSANFQYVNDSPVSWWMGQALDAAMWGATVLFPESKGLTAGISIAASLFGSTLSATAWQPASVNFTDIAGKISAAYGSTMDLTQTAAAAFLSDGVRLNMVGALAQSTWAVPNQVDQSDVQATEVPNRIGFYQTILSAVAAIEYWAGVGSPVTTPPDQGSWSMPNPDPGGSWYWWYRIGDTYPQALQDIFDTLNVPASSFYLGQGGWAAIGRLAL